MDMPVLPGEPASQGTVIEQTRAVAEVAAAVRVARDFPRDMDRVMSEVVDLCGRLPVAERAFYTVPNRGSGMSVHIARELGRIYSNVDYGVRELRRDDIAGESEMQAWAWDQEQNVRSSRSFIQPHQRMKAGKRQALTDLNDIYLANQNTAARAVRECLFTILPGSLLTEAERLLRATLEHGEGKPMAQRRSEAITAFDSLKITEKQLVSHLGAAVKDWAPADLAELARIYTSVTVDGIPVVDFFPEPVVNVAELGEKAS